MEHSAGSGNGLEEEEADFPRGFQLHPAVFRKPHSTALPFLLFTRMVHWGWRGDARTPDLRITNPLLELLSYSIAKRALMLSLVHEEPRERAGTFVTDKWLNDNLCAHRYGAARFVALQCPIRLCEVAVFPGRRSSESRSD